MINIIIIIDVFYIDGPKIVHIYLYCGNQR